jgi:predicted nicotinamide N-methyase
MRALTETPATRYDGPVVFTSVDLDGRTLRIARPADPDRLLDDPAVLEWNRRDNYMPYWAYLWPSAYLLAAAVGRTLLGAPAAGEPRAQVLEIGCGLGLAGLAALARGAHVVLTDIDQAALQFVERSAAENGFERARFELRFLDWRDLPDERFPLILGADVIYETPLVPLVANLLYRLLAPGGVGLIASPFRVSAGLFPSALASCGLVCRAEAVRARAEDGHAIDGTIYHVTRGAPELDRSVPTN